MFPPGFLALKVAAAVGKYKRRARVSSERRSQDSNDVEDGASAAPARVTRRTTSELRDELRGRLPDRREVALRRSRGPRCRCTDGRGYRYRSRYRHRYRAWLNHKERTADGGAGTSSRLLSGCGEEVRRGAVRASILRALPAAPFAVLPAAAGQPLPGWGDSGLLALLIRHRAVAPLFQPWPRAR